MRSFLKFIGETKTAENSGHVVVSFIRGNPPHEGHGEVIRAGQEEARRVGGRHVVIVSHSQDPKKNPLNAKQKIKHFQRGFPGVRFEASSPTNPTLLHHLSRMHDAGHREVTIVGGSDRDTMGQMAQQYNGVEGKTHGYYKMKMHFKQAGETRSDTDEGVASYSASRMRGMAKSGDYEGFRKMAPKSMKDGHVKEMFNETRKGMGVK
jgi:hypothetical protein